MKKNTKRIRLGLRIGKPLYCIFLLALILSCGRESKNPEDGTDKGYDITADLEFSSGKVLAFKGRSVTPSIDEPFVTNNAGQTWIWTPGYQMEKEGIKYRMNLKALVKDEKANYALYTKPEDYLEVPGWYIELLVMDKSGNTQLYQCRYEGKESGELAITALSTDRLEASFSADIPRSPDEGDHVTIKNGKVKTKIQRIN